MNQWYIIILALITYILQENNVDLVFTGLHDGLFWHMMESLDMSWNTTSTHASSSWRAFVFFCGENWALDEGNRRCTLGIGTGTTAASSSSLLHDHTTFFLPWLLLPLASSPVGCAPGCLSTSPPCSSCSASPCGYGTPWVPSSIVLLASLMSGKWVTEVITILVLLKCSMHSH